jgi:hypothetical protein
MQQDTVKQKIIAGNDSLKQTRDTTSQEYNKPGSIKVVSQTINPVQPVAKSWDTATICRKGKIANITFTDPANFVLSLDRSVADRAPFILTENNLAFSNGERGVLVKALKEGNELPPQQYQSDWIVPLLMFAMFLFALVRSFPGDFFRNMLRFILMRGINESASRDTGPLYQWQATLLNFSSFISISLFGYLLVRHFYIQPGDIQGFTLWLILFGIVVSAITSRHLICTLTGSISGQVEVFREYINGIYHVYRAAGIIFLILGLLILYTTYLPSNIYFFTGIIIGGLLYILRISRLLLIFITRHVSIFYLILYLCALEILPVVIIVKYVTGLV